MKNYLAEKIDKKYVGDDCAQIMLSYQNFMRIKNSQSKDIVFLHEQNKGSITTGYINEYLNDGRRKQFPFSDIPMHQERIGLKKYTFVNQLFNYNTIYEIDSEYDDSILYCKVIKIGENAVIIRSYDYLKVSMFSSDDIEKYDIKPCKELKIEKQAAGKKPIINEEELTSAIQGTVKNSADLIDESNVLNTPSAYVDDNGDLQHTNQPKKLVKKPKKDNKGNN